MGRRLGGEKSFLFRNGTGQIHREGGSTRDRYAAKTKTSSYEADFERTTIDFRTRPQLSSAVRGWVPIETPLFRYDVFWVSRETRNRKMRRKFR